MISKITLLKILQHKILEYIAHCIYCNVLLIIIFPMLTCFIFDDFSNEASINTVFFFCAKGAIWCQINLVRKFETS